MKKDFRIALAGNPNCGKTTIFNLLTGAHQHIGNYPGVTVERKSGKLKIDELHIEVVDLPGIYSLTGSSPEERVAFEELIRGDIDLVVNVIDAGNAQRNLYLSTQLAELKIPMLLDFNMIDDAHRRGIKFNSEIIERYFNAPVVKTVGARNRGMDKLREAICHALMTSPRIPHSFHYGEDLDGAIAELLPDLAGKGGPVPVRYTALKLLEDDAELLQSPEYQSLLPKLDAIRKRLEVRCNISGAPLVADRRYGVVAGVCREAIRLTGERRRQLSENIDKVLANQYLGLPIFLVIIFVLFLFTFTCATPFVDLLEAGFGKLGNTIEYYWPANHAVYLRDLIVNGVIGGVGGVLSFLPNILFLFLGISILEGTGYMARAAFVMDGVMHKFGLHGKSFIPMLLGFGCTVPAVMATRTIESRRDRLTTIMILPLMSCGARLPIYSLIIPAFFPERFQALTMWLIYLIGIVLALICARLLKSTLFKGEDEIFVMELPPYRLPTFQSILLHMWENTKMYLQKAGTIILAASVILYVLNTFPVRPEGAVERSIAAVEASSAPKEEKSKQLEELKRTQAAENLSHSMAGRIGKGLEKVLAPAGFDWQVSSALIGAFAAKELFVSQLGILSQVGENVDEQSQPMREYLRRRYTPLQGFCIMLFCLISMPCIATVAVVRRETGSTWLTLLQLVGLTLLAYAAAVIVFQIGRIFI